MQFSRATSSMVGPVIGSSCILCTLLGYIRVFAEIGTLAPLPGLLKRFKSMLTSKSLNHSLNVENRSSDNFRYVYGDESLSQVLFLRISDLSILT